MHHVVARGRKGACKQAIVRPCSTCLRSGIRTYEPTGPTRSARPLNMPGTRAGRHQPRRQVTRPCAFPSLRAPHPAAALLPHLPRPRDYETTRLRPGTNSHHMHHRIHRASHPAHHRPSVSCSPMAPPRAAAALHRAPAFACSFCGKMFGRAGHCKRHELTHTNAARHRCCDCGKNFVRRCVPPIVPCHVPRWLIARQ